MATLPGKIEKISSVESDEFSSVAVSTWGKAARLIEYLNKSYPMGMLMFFDASLDNLPAMPNPNYWKFCDGSVIVNANSPMNGQNAPDCRNKFIKHPQTGDPTLVTAGSDTVSSPHNHGGVTGVGSDADALRLDDGQEHGFAIGNHTHSIGGSSNDVTSTVPLHRFLQVYMRIC